MILLVPPNRHLYFLSCGLIDFSLIVISMIDLTDCISRAIGARSMFSLIDLIKSMRDLLLTERAYYSNCRAPLQPTCPEFFSVKKRLSASNFRICS